MFTIEQIKAAHAKVKSGADYPAYVQDIIKLGVINYCNYVSDGNTIYNGKQGYAVQSGAKYPAMVIAEKSDAIAFTDHLKQHQQGKTDFPAFCRHSAQTGVEKWIGDLEKMTCTYYDKAGNILLVEAIPTAK